MWKDPDKQKAYRKKYYAEHCEEIKTRARQQYANNPERCKKRLRDWRHRVKLETISAYGGKCAYCGEADPVVLCIDHINDDGAKHRRTIGTIGMFYWLRKNDWPTGFQLLCANCNMRKESVRRGNEERR